jgi:hypothetical protein
MVITGDMHVGAKYALHTGEFAKLSKPLEAVKDLWYSARDKLLKPRSDIFFINGEHIEGANRKELGHDVWSTDLNDQFADAETLLRHYKFDGIGMNRGSNYHTTLDNTGFEEMFLNSIRIPGVKVYEYSPFDTVRTVEWGNDNKPNNRNGHIRVDDLFLCRLNGRVFHIMHHIGGSKWFSYIPTAAGREHAQLKFFNEKLWETKDSPDITLRSHTHRYVQIRFGHSTIIVCPAWKIFDRFLLKSGQDAGSLGLVEIVVESNGQYEINDIIMENKFYPKLNIIDI